MFCSWSKWTFTAKEDWGRWLEIRLTERPGHGLKWPLLMVDMKVDLTGLEAVAWKYWESLRLVVSWRRMSLAWFRSERFDDC